MPYDAKLAERVRHFLARRKTILEKKMMGGIVFMLRGNLCCGVDKDHLIVRVGPEKYHEALAQPHARPMDITGRPLTGFVLVGPQGHKTEERLQAWILQGIRFATSLPPKQPQANTVSRRRPGRDVAPNLSRRSPQKKTY